MSRTDDLTALELADVRRLAAKGKDPEAIAAAMSKKTDCPYTATYVRKLAKSAGITLPASKPKKGKQ